MRLYTRGGENWVHEAAVGYFQNVAVSVVCKETGIGHLEILYLYCTDMIGCVHFKRNIVWYITHKNTYL